MHTDIAAAIRHEHAATVQAVQHAQARALHLGEMLLDVRAELGPVIWDYWLEHGCPIPAGAARRYAS